jgi:hypothetical protein
MLIVIISVYHTLYIHMILEINFVVISETMVTVVFPPYRLVFYVIICRSVLYFDNTYLLWSTNILLSNFFFIFFLFIFFLWTCVYIFSEFTLSDIRLKYGIKYFTTVTACNTADLCTSVTSDGVIIDFITDKYCQIS